MFFGPATGAQTQDISATTICRLSEIQLQGSRPAHCMGLCVCQEFDIRDAVAAAPYWTIRERVGETQTALSGAINEVTF
jgi:hypothetical protein